MSVKDEGGWILVFVFVELRVGGIRCARMYS